jgi:hypothetical protein
MRATSSAKQGIKIVSDERDICDAAYETASVCIRLTGRQIVHHRCAESMGTDFGNARTRNISRVGANIRDHYTGGVQAASSAFGDIKEPIRTKLQAARIVQSSGKNRDGRRSG